MKTVVAGIQMSFSADKHENIDRTCYWIEQAAQKGAQVVLPSELFQNVYFCTQQEEHWFEEARALNQSEAVQAMRKLAKKLNLSTLLMM